MSPYTVLLFASGLGLLLVGAEWLVRGAARLASAAGVSPLVVGLTVVAFGTGSPEMAVSLQSALSGAADIAYGNVVGSNIVNVLVILGASALVAPLPVNRQLVRLDVPIMIAVSTLLLALARSGRISRVEGLVLVMGSVLYVLWLLRESRKEKRREPLTEEFAEEFGKKPKTPAGLALNAGFVLAGLALLILGSRFVVQGAVEFARLLGLSELVIGITVIAAGTSLPELATSVLASFRGERDIAIGNVVGSNIFNILGVLGTTALVSPDGVAVARQAVVFDTPVMVAVAFACLPIFLKNRIARWEGALFLGYYGAYVAYILLDASGHQALPRFSGVMKLFVIPLTVLTLGIVTVGSLRRQQRAGARRDPL